MSEHRFPCMLGVHTDGLRLSFSPEVWDAIKAAMPSRVGFRRWTVMERDGGFHFSRTQYTGCTPGLATDKMAVGHMFLKPKLDPIVRSAVTAREIEVVNPTRFAILMPPHYLWPWIKETGRSGSAGERRWRLVQELNARVVSAGAHHVDMPEDWPEWVDRMLTEGDKDNLRRNEELVR